MIASVIITAAATYFMTMTFAVKYVTVGTTADTTTTLKTTVKTDSSKFTTEKTGDIKKVPKKSLDNFLSHTDGTGKTPILPPDQGEGLLPDSESVYVSRIDSSVVYKDTWYGGYVVPLQILPVL